jgi:hypothetical protein
MLRELKKRFMDELPLWRLSFVQLLFLLLWSLWPVFSKILLSEHEGLALIPIVIFLPFTYIGGSLASALFQNWPYAYVAGTCFTIFCLAYLGLVSWRQGLLRKKNRNPNN